MASLVILCDFHAYEAEKSEDFCVPHELISVFENGVCVTDSYVSEDEHPGLQKLPSRQKTAALLSFVLSLAYQKHWKLESSIAAEEMVVYTLR